MQPALVIRGQVSPVTNRNGSASVGPETTSIVLESSLNGERNSARGVVEPDGTFTLTGLFPGTWNVMLASPDPNDALQSIAWGARPVKGREIEISADQTGPLESLRGRSPAEA